VPCGGGAVRNAGSANRASLQGIRLRPKLFNYFNDGEVAEWLKAPHSKFGNSRIVLSPVVIKHAEKSLQIGDDRHRP
jgi:hypothetical protein